MGARDPGDRSAQAVSLLPLDTSAWESFMLPHLAGARVDVALFLSAAMENGSRSHRSRRWARALEAARQAIERPSHPPLGLGSAWRTARALARDLARGPDRLRGLLAGAVDPEVHLHGRPFFIGEDSASRVADAIDAYWRAPDAAEIDRLASIQLGRLSAEFEKLVPLEEDSTAPSHLPGKEDLALELRVLRELVLGAGRGETLTPPDGRPVLARELLAESLPWRAVSLMARAHPCWLARDGAGLAELCMAAGVLSPEELESPRRLFTELLCDYPEMAASLGFEIRAQRHLGAFVPPEGIAGLLAFLKSSGGRLIQAATRQGQARRCALYLGKVREAAAWASRHGYGLLEAAALPGPEDPLPEGLERYLAARVRRTIPVADAAI